MSPSRVTNFLKKFLQIKLYGEGEGLESPIKIKSLMKNSELSG